MNGFNAFIHEGASEVILDGYMGHGPSLLQPGAQLCPLGLDDTLKLATETALALYQRYGIDKIAVILADKLTALVNQAACASAEPLMTPDHAPVRRVSDWTELEPRDAPFRFLSPAETFRLAEVCRLRQPELTSDKKCVPEAPDILDRVALNSTGLMILLALDLGIPIQTMIRLAQYYHVGNFLTDKKTGNMYFLALGEHDNVGRLSALPLYVCHESEKERNRIWCLVERLFSKRTPVTKLFPSKVRKSAAKKLKALPELQNQLAHSFSRMVRQGTYRSTLSSEDYFSLLQRASEFTCFRKYPGPVYFALARGVRYGLNHVAVEDVIEGLNGRFPDLVYAIDGSRYVPEPGPSKSTSVLPEELIDGLREEKNEAQRLEKFRAVLVQHDVPASIDKVRGLLKKIGYTAKELKRVVRDIMVFYRESGRYQISKPVRVLIDAAQDALVRAIENGDNLDDSLMALICLITSSRAGELPDLKLFPQNKCFPIAYIPEGKSLRAKRWIPLRLFGNPTTLEILGKLCNRLPKKADGTMLFHCGANAKETSARLAAFLERIGYGYLSAHSLRRQFVIRSAVGIMSDIRTINALAALCHLAIICGHGSLGVTLREYVGTYILVFGKVVAAGSGPIPDTMVSKEQAAELDRLAFKHAFGSYFLAEKRLKAELRGDVEYKVSLESDCRQIRSYLAKGNSEIPLRITLTSKPFASSMADDITFECPLKKPKARSEQVAWWEKAVLRLINLCHKRGRSIVVQNHSLNPKFREALEDLATEKGMVLTEIQ